MGFPNSFSSDKFNVRFSNIPTINDTKVDMRLFDLYVKSIIVSDINEELVNSDILNFQIRHPITRANESLNQLIVEFVLDEDFTNYFTFFNFMQQERYLYTENTPSEPNDVFRLNNISTISLELLDNQGRARKYLDFTEAYLTSLNSLNLIMGLSEQVTFNASFQYEQVLFREESET
jgi:hypothetical protein